MTKPNELLLYGSVGASWWDEEFFTAKQVRDWLANASGDITVRINSGGGIASEGQAIYTALSDYPHRVTVTVDSVAASAASLIAMAGDDIVIRRGAFMLIHDPATPWTPGRGTEHDHLKEAELLGVIANVYADVYAHRAGMTREEARKIMTDETVMDGPTAIDLGFATAVDTEADAVAAATFDYRIYAHAPAHLRKASRTLGRAPEPVAIMAMMAGQPRRQVQPPKETPMSKGTNLAVEVSAAAATEVETVAAPGAVTETTPPSSAAAPGDAVATASLAERQRARRITDAVASAGLPIDMAARLIGDGASVEAALDEITAKWKEKGDVDTPTIGRATATIQRDERDTRNIGMTAALHAQIGMVKPADDRALPYMGMGLVEMAAQAIGHRGAIRSASDRLDVLEMAMHSTSDFPVILENALNKRLGDAYALAAPTYTAIAERMDFTDFRPHPVSRLSDFPLMEEVGETGEIKFGTLSEKKESVLLKSYGKGLALTRQVLINDDMRAIDRMLRNTGTSVAAFEDQTFWAMALGGSNGDGPTMTETTRQMFNATDLSKAGTAAAISVTSLSAARAALRKRKRLDGTDLDVTGAILLVGPDKETEAQQVVAPIQAQQAGNVNPFSGTLRVVTTAKITGNAWYVFADPMVLANFIYGFLQGDSGPRMRMDTPFGTQGVRFSIERDFGCGAVDWRGGFKNAGA